MNSNKILSDIQSDLSASKTAKHKVEEQITSWKRGYDGMKYGNEQRHRSAMVSKDIQKHVETMRPSLVEPFMGSETLIKVKATNSSSLTSASYNQHILNYQKNSQFDWLSFIDTISSVLPKEGTVFIRTGWNLVEDTKTRQMNNMLPEQLQAASQLGEVTKVEKNKDGTFNATLVSKKIVKNHPTSIVCRNEDIYTDPTSNGDLENAKFIIHEYEVSYSDILKDKVSYPNRESLDKIKGYITNRDPDSLLESERYENTGNLGTDTSFNFSSDSMKKVKLVEYWGEADLSGTGETEQCVCVYVKDTNFLLRLEKNPYPDNEMPFVSCPYSREAFTMWGKALAHSLSDNQKIRTAIVRGFIDNFALANNGQKFFQKGSIDYPNMKKLASGYRFIEMNNIDGMKDGSYNEMPQSAYNLYNMVEAESEALSGVNKNMNGLDSATVGRTASGVNMVMSAAQNRTMMTVRNISNMLTKMFRKWSSYNAEFLDDGTIFDINGEYLQVNREELQGSHDFTVRISMDTQNQGKMQQINMMMQQLAADGDQPIDQEIRKELVAEFFDSMGKNEMAERLRSTPPPEPSPQEQQMMQMEIRMKELESALQEAKVGDTNASAELKQAQTQEIMVEMGKPDFSVEDKMVEMELKQQDSEQKRYNNAQDHQQKLSQSEQSHRLQMLQKASEPQ